MRSLRSQAKDQATEEEAEAPEQAPARGSDEPAARDIPYQQPISHYNLKRKRRPISGHLQA